MENVKIIESKNKNNDIGGIFRGISEYSPNAIIVTDNNLCIKFFNIAAEELTGISKKDAIDNCLYSILPQISEIMNKEDFNKNISILPINGKDFHMKVFIVKDKDDVNFTVFLMHDTSEEVKLSLELEKNHYIIQELEDIVEGSFDGVLVTDGEGNVILVNKSYERVTGITKEEMIGKNMKELINPIWMKNSVVFLVMEKKSAISLHHTTRTGKNIIVTGTPIIDKNGDISKVVVNARDITEIYELREELLKSRKMELFYLKNVSDADYKIAGGGGIVVVSDIMKDLFNLVNKVSTFDTTILILGESGVGKDVIAKYIHENSIRREKPFIVINCGAIPEQLLESELFGYEGGAFTGASKEGKIGLFEAAEGGVLFLDEIGEMSLNLQVKLLNVLESRQITRVGSIKPVSVDVRIIAATNRNLKNDINSGSFREDLYYRINVIQINIPPLRDRIQDIAPLSLYFLKIYNQKYGQDKKLTYDIINEFENYNWTGNIRELKNTMENMVIVSNNEFLQLNDLPWHNKDEKENKLNQTSQQKDSMSLNKAVEMTEKQILIRAKKEYKTTREIAEAVGINQSTVVRKLRKYGISTNKDDE